MKKWSVVLCAMVLALGCAGCKAESKAPAETAKTEAAKTEAAKESAQTGGGDQAETAAELAYPEGFSMAAHWWLRMWPAAAP